MTLLLRWWIIIASGQRLHLPQMLQSTQLQSFFQNYRASSHATTGVSVFEQFELLRGKNMRTKSATTPQGEEVAMDIRDSVQQIQQKMKQYTDQKC